MKKSIILLRHGITPGNEKRRYIGCRTDEDLSKEGIDAVENAKERIKALAGEDAVIISSPMTRARHTAKIIFDDRNISVIDDLKEMDFGIFEGKNYEELKDNDAYQSWIDSGCSEMIPGGECREEFGKRSYIGFMEAVNATKKDGSCFIICHGGNIMAVMSKLTGKEYYDFMVGNIQGYKVDLVTDGKRVLDMSYSRID